MEQPQIETFAEAFRRKAHEFAAKADAAAMPDVKQAYQELAGMYEQMAASQGLAKIWDAMQSQRSEEG